jgi:hypothetical protein
MRNNVVAASLDVDYPSVLGVSGAIPSSENNPETQPLCAFIPEMLPLCRAGLRFAALQPQRQAFAVNLVSVAGLLAPSRLDSIGESTLGCWRCDFGIRVRRTKRLPRKRVSGRS